MSNEGVSSNTTFLNPLFSSMPESSSPPLSFPSGTEVWPEIDQPPPCSESGHSRRPILSNLTRPFPFPFPFPFPWPARPIPEK